MQRLLIVLLAAVDAVVAAAVGLGLLLAPLTLFWAISQGAAADWGALWPSTVSLWQYGHGAPLDVSLPDALVRAAGIAPEAARFVLSVPPLLFLAITAFLAARSGRRAALAGSWITGVGSGTAVFGVVAVGVALTGRSTILSTPLPLAILAPTLVFLAGALLGALTTAWAEGDGGVVDRVQDALERHPDWVEVPGEIVRGATVVMAGVVGAAGIALAIAALTRGGQVVALFESLRVDAFGTIVIGLAQLAFLPTLLAWGVAWLAGPGFAIGTGTAVSPAGTALGVVPGVPLFGLVPESSSPWLLIVVLVPIGAGAFAGWVVRSRQVSAGIDAPLLPRVAAAVGIAAVSAGAGAALAALSHGSLGPGRLAEAGPEPWTVALALGAEVLVGAAILLLAPRRRSGADLDLDERGHLLTPG
ncbi:DUF6350 family protein [uncultured Microbacterium sp.]|uniref:cell division protein PerM n=1 Tax=uncultured Microbacterium sp. TaxID=191216 RepID=UPI0025D60F02|nr:DUF6350 family protein [uncultured Microbacterium sp.]